MSRRHEERRRTLLEAGKCPMCAGREDILPGLKWGAKCKAQNALRVRPSEAKGLKRSPIGRQPELPSEYVPADTRTIWEILETGTELDRAIKEAEMDLAEAV